MSGMKKFQYLFRDNADLPRKLKAKLCKAEIDAAADVDLPATSGNRQTTQRGILDEPNVRADLIEGNGPSCDVLMGDCLGTLDYGVDYMDSGESSTRLDDCQYPNSVNCEETHHHTVDTLTENFWEALALSEDIGPAPLITDDPNDVRYDGYYSDEDQVDEEIEGLYDKMKKASNNSENLENLAKIVSISNEMDVNVLFLTVLKFSLKHKLSFSAIVGLLKIVNFICGDKVLPETRYFLDKKCNTTENYELHAVCHNCTEYLGTFQDRKVIQCQNCTDSVDMTNPSNRCFFAIFDPEEPVRDYLQMNEDYYDNVMNGWVHEKNHIKDFQDGRLYRKFRLRLSPEDFRSFATFILNADGVPIFESSRCSCTPIYLMLNEIPPQKRFECMILVGLWCGKSKPVMDVFLKQLVLSMKKFAVDGISCVIKGKEKIIKLFTLQSSVDTIARFYMNCTKQFNAKCGCDWCLQEGMIQGDRINDNSRIYPYQFPLDSRTMENTILFAKRALETGEAYMGVNSVTPLIDWEWFDIIFGFSPEYMHQYLAGVVAQITEYILSSLSSAEIEILNRSLTKIKVPNQLCRLSRSLEFRADYKCKEWENWALYYSIPLLSMVMKNKAQLKHWSLLVNSLYLGLKMDITYDDLNHMSEMLHQFVKDIPLYYPLRALTYNVHQLLHIVESICNWGPLWAHSAFYFEAAHRKILAGIHSEKGIILQIIRYMNLFRYQQKLESYLYPQCSDVEISFLTEISGARAQKAVKLDSVSYFGDGQPVNQAYAHQFGISERALSYGRAVIEGSLYTTIQKDNMRTCNYFARLKNGKFIKIRNFIVDFDSRQEFTECDIFQVRRNHLSGTILEIGGISKEEELIRTDEIDYPCVFIESGTKEFIIPVANKLYY